MVSSHVCNALIPELVKTKHVIAKLFIRSVYCSDPEGGGAGGDTPYLSRKACASEI